MGQSPAGLPDPIDELFGSPALAAFDAWIDADLERLTARWSAHAAPVAACLNGSQRITAGAKAA
jgi:hypothetical protein